MGSVSAFRVPWLGGALALLMLSSCGGAVKDGQPIGVGSGGHSFAEGGSGTAGTLTSFGGMGVAGQPVSGAPSEDSGGADTSGEGGSSGATTDPCAGPLSFADPDVETLLRTQIGKPTEPLYAADFADVTALDWVPSGPGPCPTAPNCPTPAPPQSDGWVTSLAGLECLPHVQSILIDAWFVEDFSELSALSDLRTLEIFFSKRARFPSLPQLRELRVLNSDGDLAELPEAPNLTSLSVHLPDLSVPHALAPLSSRKSIRNLVLKNSAIADVTGLETLTSLETLDLSGNNLSDLSPLLQNGALGFGTTIDIHDNPITCDNPSVTTLVERKVRVVPCTP